MHVQFIPNVYSTIYSLFKWLGYVIYEGKSKNKRIFFNFSLGRLVTPLVLIPLV